MLYAIVAVLALLLDQAVKYYVTLQIDLNTGVQPLIPKVVSLMNIHNTGAAFSMLAGKQEFLIGVTAVAMLVMLCILLRRKAPNAFAHWGLAMVVGGGIGNLIDRVLNGYVVDYFDVVFMKFAIFNVADCFVVVGCVCLFIGVLFSEAFDARRTRRAAVQAPEATANTEEENDAE